MAAVPQLLRPDDHALKNPDRPAIIMARTGQTVSFEELAERSRRIANLLRSCGLQFGDNVAMLLDNCPTMLEVAWAARRAGLRYTPVNWHLQPEEAAYIVNDCGAKAFITNTVLADLSSSLMSKLQGAQHRFVKRSSGENLPSGFLDLDVAISTQPDRPGDGEREGASMLYSSGTTGRPKGVHKVMSGAPFGTVAWNEQIAGSLYGFNDSMVQLCPAPLYHAAPLSSCMTTQKYGGTVVVMEAFDPLEALRLIEKYRVTNVQMVPTHFVRMLKLSDAERRRYDVSSLRCVVHAAAPCPVEVKERMIEWWGSKIYEYYSSSEGVGYSSISTQEWLTHKGSVGRGLKSQFWILDENGSELPPGQEGVIYAKPFVDFEYHNDPEKTASVRDAEGRVTVGDVGYLDNDGYLYLTDRQSHMIISGGVNIYPQELESALVMHPAVQDVAVIGVPNTEFGEEVKAVVVPAVGMTAGPELADELIAYARGKVAHYKCPRSVDFVSELPRLDSGKMAKRLLRQRYWSETKVRI